MLLHVRAAWADYAESAQAFRAKDYPTALKKAQETADHGDARGSGVAQDTGQGLEWARRSAESGDAEGWFVTYVILQNEHLMYLNPNGKVNEQRYRALAARPLKERTVDNTQADDALYQAAQKNHPPAWVVLAAKLAGTVGEGNLQRFLDTLQKISPLKPSALPAPATIAYQCKSSSLPMAWAGQNSRLPNP